jgi:hypothetical protein
MDGNETRKTVNVMSKAGARGDAATTGSALTLEHYINNIDNSVDVINYIFDVNVPM